MALRPCSECKQWVYGDNGEGPVYRLGKKVARVGPPPCWSCPKKGPEQAHEFELSKQGFELYNLYRKVKATSGACLTEEQRSSSILADRLALIDTIVEADKAVKLAKQVAAGGARIG